MNQTPPGRASFANGLDQLDNGAQQLASRLGRVRDRRAPVRQRASTSSPTAPASRPTGAGKLAKGGKKLASGADQLADGADGIAGGLKVLQNGSKQTQGLGTEVVREEHGRVRRRAGAVRRVHAGASSADDRLSRWRRSTRSSSARPQLPAEACPAYYAGLTAGIDRRVPGPAEPRRRQDARPGQRRRPVWPGRGWPRLDRLRPAVRPGRQDRGHGVREGHGLSSPTVWASYADGVGQLADRTRQAGRPDRRARHRRSRSSRPGADQISDGRDSAGRRHRAVGRRGGRSSTTGVSKLADGRREARRRHAASSPTGWTRGRTRSPATTRRCANKLSSVVTTPVTVRPRAEDLPRRGQHHPADGDRAVARRAGHLPDLARRPGAGCWPR